VERLRAVLDKRLTQLIGKQDEIERLKELIVSWACRLDAGGADESVFDEIFVERKRIEDE
jgi:hypothetical protein